MAQTPRPVPVWLAASLFLVSGAAVLGLETVWIRTIALRIGNTVPAASVAIGLFFLSAAAGNLLGGRLVRRHRSPLRLYGLLEAGAAALAVAGYFLASIPTLPDGMAIALLVAPPSLLGGASLAAIAEATVASLPGRTRTGPLLYGANLLGGGLGIAAGALFLPLRLGFSGTVLALCGALAAAGLAAFAAGARFGARRPAETGTRESSPSGGMPPRIGATVAALSGFLALSLEILLLVTARQLVSGSVYVTTALLLLFFAGLAGGAGLTALLRRLGLVPSTLLAIAATAPAVAVVVVSTRLPEMLAAPLDFEGLTPATMLVEALAALAPIVLPLAAAAGMLFPACWESLARLDRHHGAVLARASALNKVAAAAGVVAASFLFLPALGLNGAMAALGVAYACLAGGFLARLFVRRGIVPVAGVVVAGVAVAWLVFPAREAGPSGPDIATVVDLDFGPYGQTAVVESVAGSRQIILNTHFRLNGTGSGLATQRSQAAIPLVLAHRTGSVLTIGMASGITASSLIHPGLKHLVAVELVPGVVEAAREHFAPWNAAVFQDPRVRVVVDDGRQVVRDTTGPLDLIVIDLLFPSMDGVADLYSTDFLRLLRRKLGPGGTLCLWLPIHQFDAGMASSVFHGVGAVFENVLIIRGNLDGASPVIGLLASDQPFDLSREALSRGLDRLGHRPGAFLRSAKNFRLVLAGDLKAAPVAMREGPETSDNRPWFHFHGPRTTASRDRLVGFNYLDWIGRPFVEAPLPSALIPPEELPGVRGGIRAGNYLIAAATTLLAPPGSGAPSPERLAKAAGYLDTARRLLPGLEIFPADLGR